MAVSTRHLHHQNIAAAATTINETDVFQKEPRSFTSGGGRARPNQRRQPSTVVLDPLSDENSELAKFLLVEKSEISDGGGWFTRFRRNVRAGDDGGMRSMGTFKCDAYFLALEPMEIRSERITMLSEAYTIFGGLFLGGTWILYEWGSPLAYGGVSAPGDESVDRAFAAVMAIAICCNIFLALWSSLLWINSIVYGSCEDFVFKARKLLAFCSALLFLTISVVTWGCVQGVIINLRPNWPETIVVASIAIILQLVGVHYVNDLLLAVCPLAVFHMPIWLRAISNPSAVFTHNGREKLRKRAKNNAEKLKSKACRGRENLESSSENNQHSGNIGSLLRRAAINLGRIDYDVSIYEARLEEDWFNESNQLEDKSVDFLSRYMPYRLAEEVHTLVEVEHSESSVKMKSIYVSE